MSKLKAGQVIKLWWLDSPPSFAILIEDEEGGKTDSLHCFHVGSKHNDQHASREQAKRRNAMNIATINKMNNKTFSTSVKSFQAACEKAGIVPTKRQASKWRNKTGAAFACK